MDSKKRFIISLISYITPLIFETDYSYVFNVFLQERGMESHSHLLLEGADSGSALRFMVPKANFDNDVLFI